MWDPEIGSESSEGGWCDRRGRGGSDDGKYRGLLTAPETKGREWRNAPPRILSEEMIQLY